MHKGNQEQVKSGISQVDTLREDESNKCEWDGGIVAWQLVVVQDC